MPENPTNSTTEETIWTGTSSQVKNFWLFVACILVIPIPWAVWAWLKTKCRIYSLTTERLIIRSGVLNKSTETLELYRVRDLQINEPFWLRLWGLKNIHLCTTDTTTPEVILDYISSEIDLGTVFRKQIEFSRQKKGVREFGIDVEHGTGHLGEGNVGNMIRGFLDKDEPAGGAVPTRDQVPTDDTWNLTLLYATPADWDKDFTDLQGRYEAIAQFRGRVGESARTLLAALEFDKSLSLQIERLYHYASLKTSEDSSDAANLARESQMQNLLTRIGEACSFLTPELQAIDDAEFAGYLADPALAEWVISLQKIRRLKPHTLSAAEERLLALGSSALRGHNETFSQLTDVDMKFGKLADEEGVERELTQSSFVSFLYKRDAGLRNRAFKQFYTEFDDHKFTCASTLANSVKADVFHARARNYPSALEAALFNDDVPVAVYDNLIAAVRASLQPLFRYYQLRKRVLQLDEIHHYDTYVPLVAEIETNIPWDEAVRKVIAALEPLGDEYCRTLADGLSKARWCDRYENKGKRSGAFSSSSYGNPPYILMNYKADVFSDVYTLAHEAGHSMHTWYSQRAQRYQEYNYPIFLAEVASTFNEELLTHHLLAETQDPKMRAYLISRQLDDIRGTVYRQTMFAEFEKLIHAMEESGEPLTLETFRQTYRGLLDAYFGQDVVIDSELELECFRIPHFYSAFYVYKYATGISAAIALSQQVIESENAQRYLGFLESGSSKFPIPTLRDAGVDMSSPAPIEATLQLFARRVEELENLLS